MADLLALSCADATSARLNTIAAYVGKRTRPIHDACISDPAEVMKALRQLAEEVAEAFRDILVDIACEHSRRSGEAVAEAIKLHQPTDEYVAATGIIGAPVQQSDRTGA